MKCFNMATFIAMLIYVKCDDVMNKSFCNEHTTNHLDHIPQLQLSSLVNQFHILHYLGHCSLVNQLSWREINYINNEPMCNLETKLRHTQMTLLPHKHTKKAIFCESLNFVVTSL